MATERLSQVEKILGPPYFAADGILLYNGDCVEYLRELSRPIFDLIVTSPPYNIGKEYERPLSLAEYVAWCEGWMKLLHQVSRPSGQFWLNLGYTALPNQGKAVPLPYLLWDKSPFFMVQEIVWNYGAGVAATRSFSPRNEKWIWYVKDPDDYYFDLDAVRDPNVKYPNQKKNGKLKCNPGGKNPTDVWEFPKVTSGRNRSSRERTAHPAQFPRAVVSRIIQACSGPESLVLDPFIGSGTVAEVGRAVNRQVVGFELRRDYLDMAVHRLTARSEQQALPSIED